VSQAADLVDENFGITKESSREFLRKFLEAFAAWIELTRKR